MFQMRILQLNFRRIDHVSNPNYTTWFYSRDVVIQKGNTHVRLIGHVNILCLACICVVRAFISCLHCGILSTGVVFLNRDNLETQASQYSLYLSFILEVEFVDILNYVNVRWTCWCKSCKVRSNAHQIPYLTVWYKWKKW